MQSIAPSIGRLSRCHSICKNESINRSIVLQVRSFSAVQNPASSESPPSTSNQINANTKKTQRRKGRIRPLTALGLLGVAGLLTYEIDTHLNASVLQRNLRTAIAGAEIALDYKFNFKSGDAKSAEELHERCAKRLLKVCESNGGLYIKLGQAIGVQAAVLPKPYHALAKMFDDAEHMSTKVVRAVVEKELGRPIDEVYSSFDDEPIAAASVAQVHKAILKSTGETVAVKVQRPSIRSQAYWDLLSFRILLHFYSHIFDLPLSYFGGYISEQIERETDFLAELENGKKARNNIAQDPQKVIRETCYVPWCVDDLSTSRILTMEFIQGATRMTDEKGIRNMGLNIKEVARSVCEVFASQIFQHGFIQCDGHAGNVLVRKHPSGKKGQHQIVLIDHGLYVSISETFRRQYAELWKAIFEVDIATLERITTAWGMGKQSAELFASATLMRPWRKPKTDEEREKEEEERKKNNGQPNYNKQKEMIKNFLVSVELVPKELIFVGRSMRIVQANNQVLHSPVNRINILARHAASALLTSDSPTLLSIFRPHGKQKESSMMDRLKFWTSSRISFLTFRTTLLLLDGVFVGSALWRGLKWSYNLFFATITHGPFSKQARKTWNAQSGGFEDDLEQGMRQLAKDEFGVELDENAFMG